MGRVPIVISGVKRLNPYWDARSYSDASHRFVSLEPAWQQQAQINDCSRQNPAYRYALMNNGFKL